MFILQHSDWYNLSGYLCWTRPRWQPFRKNVSMSKTICYSRVVRCNVDNLKMQIMQTKPDHFDRKITNNNLLDWIVSIVFYIHLKLELPTQFLASNVIKIFLFILNIHLLNYLTNWPSTTNHFGLKFAWNLVYTDLAGQGLRHSAINRIYSTWVFNNTIISKVKENEKKYLGD